MQESSISPFHSRRAAGSAPEFEPPLDASGAAAVGHGRGLRARRRSSHDGRSPGRRAEPQLLGDETDSSAAYFAERSLRLVLEVIDGRRPLGQLRAVVEPTVLAAVETLARTATAERRLGAAALVTVKTVEVSPHAAEVFGGYERGRRRFAIAARLVSRRGRWRLSALRMR